VSLYLINISQENWPECEPSAVFGIPEHDQPASYPRRGNIVFVRRCRIYRRHTDLTGGCVAIWEFESQEKVPEHLRQGPNQLIPWSDDVRYCVKQQYKLLAKFHEPLSECFNSNRYSEVLGWHINVLHHSLLKLSRPKAEQYVRFVLNGRFNEILPPVRIRLIAESM
jgi:hypothetical protein